MEDSTRTPDFETWWTYFRKGYQYLEVKPSTMKIVRGWRHRNTANITKSSDDNALVTVDGYFKQCLAPAELSEMVKGMKEGGEE